MQAIQELRTPFQTPPVATMALSRYVHSARCLRRTPVTVSRPSSLSPSPLVRVPGAGFAPPSAPPFASYRCLSFLLAGPPRTCQNHRRSQQSGSNHPHNRDVASPRATATSSSLPLPLPLPLLQSPYSTSTSSLLQSHSASPQQHSSPPPEPPKSRTPSFDREVAQLAALPLHPLTLSDLVRFGKPPLSPDLLLASASFTLRVLPIRLARRIISLRNLPYIVVSNPHISQIYNNYLHSLRLLLSFPKTDFPSTLKEESRFNDVLTEIVDTHRNTIPTLARGFSECKRYVNSDSITDFLEEHLRARIGTRLLAEQHLALHDASLTQDGRTLPGVQANDPKASTYIGTIDTHLNPTAIVKYCADFVADICELRYGQRPTVVVDGMTDAKFAYVPSHLEYILTELLKNAFRATIEKGNVDRPVIVTIASAEMDENDSDSDSDSDDEVFPQYASKRSGFSSKSGSAIRMLENGNSRDDNDGFSVAKPGTEVQGDGLKTDSMGMYGSYASSDVDASETMKAEAARAITIRIRDRGGGIAPEHLPLIFKYSFTTFNSANTIGSGGYTSNMGGDSGGMDAISSAMNEVEASTIAGLGFGMGLSRSYAQFFGGDLKVESLFGWGTDVYLGLRGLDVDRRR
ncbi:hypothetical protein H072_11546 [Dactylellina haptotyla CBS 200.50]|uniref:Protein-serine/threonine kinase n=1 Tax=Dactylellina haptotyla (strain CBS 200.50) TaxID=1284197 RepID=S7ZWU1_DACHA|nr:hypothetical protein H072_11546 [Dactylellina haptotyla CBS 200.50]